MFAPSGEASQKHNKKNEEPKTQVLPLPKELPSALAASTGELDFHLSPLLSKGKLSAQIHESLNNLIRDTKGETIIKLRAFVAGAGDARRVQAMVSEIFADHRLPLPVLSIVQIGALGTEAAQVVIEAVVQTRKTVNPDGLAFAWGQRGANIPVALDQLVHSFSEAGMDGKAVLSCTCFASQLADYGPALEAAKARFPNALVNIVQARRAISEEGSTCEAVGQLSRPVNAAMARRSEVALLKSQRTALVNSSHIVFTGMQLSFGSYLDDAQQAVTRIEHAAAQASPDARPLYVNAFTLSPTASSALRKTLHLPADSLNVQAVEGLPSVDAAAGMEAVLAPGVTAQ